MAVVISFGAAPYSIAKYLMRARKSLKSGRLETEFMKNCKSFKLLTFSMLGRVDLIGFILDCLYFSALTDESLRGRKIKR